MIMSKNNKNFTIKGLSGGHTASEVMRQINPDVVAAYPITPQSPIIEKFSEFYAEGKVDTEFVPVESEHSAMSTVVGSSAAGARSMTATASVGLALMFEVVNAASGMRLPIVMNIANRALSGPINIHCDHGDSMACRDAGWIQLYSEDAQEVYENNLLAIRISEHPDVMLPSMVMQDGFITSHSLQKVKIYDDEVIRNFVGEYKPKNFLLKGEAITYGPVALQDYFFEFKRQQEEGMRNAKKVFKEVSSELSQITGKEYNFVEGYKTDDAETIMVALNSTAGTAKVVVDRLRDKGKKVGLLKIRMYRPFPYEEVANEIKNAKNVIVLDRAISFGANPPVANDIKDVLYDFDISLNLQNYIYGLGGRDITEKHIKEAFENASKKVKNGFIGLRE